MSSTQVAFITGCSSGLGFVTVIKLIRNGYIVYATVRSQESQKKLEKACNHSENLHTFLLDLTDEKAIEKAASNCLTKTLIY